jgi:hypothetical protein
VQLTLLGPQRRPTVDQVTGRLDEGAPLATVTAGWQEREPDDAELNALLGGRGVNLGLYGRWLDVQERDREFGASQTEHQAVLEELRTLHLVQVEAALQALYALARRTGGDPRAALAALSDADAVLRLVDQRHTSRVHDANAEFSARYRVDEREVIAEHRAGIRALMEPAVGLVIAGGHVGVLLRLLELFDVQPDTCEAVIAWSAGAMALTERVVLFHDRAPQGPAAPEIYADGLALIRGVVLLPHARRRLRTDDPVRLAAMSRRFAPARCVVLDDGIRLDLAPDGRLPLEARVLSDDGRIVTLEEERASPEEDQ